MSMNKSVQRGFTLIEMLVVISIIGILATLVAANLNSARSRARDAERKSDIKNIQTALRIYYNDHNGYPASDDSDQIKGCGGTGTESCPWGSQWNEGDTVYMPTLPKDPLSPNQEYRYVAGTDTDSYSLQACLENKSDSDGIAASGTWCSSTETMFELKP